MTSRPVKDAVKQLLLVGAVITVKSRGQNLSLSGLEVRKLHSFSDVKWCALWIINKLCRGCNAK